METYSETIDSSNSGGTLSAFVAGAAIGVAVALILAPSSGRDARAYLKRRGNELGRDAMERGKETWRSQSERVKSAISTGLDRAGSAMSHVREKGESAYREARESRHGVDPSVVRTSYQRSSE
jgi:gas vesicle protein